MLGWNPGLWPPVWGSSFVILMMYWAPCLPPLLLKQSCLWVVPTLWSPSLLQTVGGLSAWSPGPHR